MYNELINSATKEYPFLIKHINVKYIPHFHQVVFHFLTLNSCFLTQK